jgi:hypothetical protein
MENAAKLGSSGNKYESESLPLNANNSHGYLIKHV